MTAGLLLVIGLGVLFLFLGLTTIFKKNKNVPNPTIVVPDTPQPSFREVKPEPTPEPKPEPEITPEPKPEVPTIVNENCYEFETSVSDTEEGVCSSNEFIKFWSSNPNALLEPSQLFMSEEACKYGRPNWDSTKSYVRLGTKYSMVDFQGNVLEMKDC
jgi:hypothetical protein